jgi:hypothetical protein
MAKSATPPSRSQPASERPAAPQQSERSGNAPVFSCRHRALKAAVWRNETETGPMFNTTVSRSYKKEGDDEWKESGSFGYDDVLIVAELLRTCHGFISREMARASEEARE